MLVIKQQNCFIETEDFRLQLDASGVNIQQRNPETDEWRQLRAQEVGGVVLHVGPHGVNVHINKPTTSAVMRGTCGTCNMDFGTARGDQSVAAMVLASTELHAKMNPTHVATITTLSHTGEMGTIHFQASNAALTPPEKN